MTTETLKNNGAPDSRGGSNPPDGKNLQFYSDFSSGLAIREGSPFPTVILYLVTDRYFCVITP